MKPAYMAKAFVYSNDVESYKGARIKIQFLKNDVVETKMTSPIIEIQHIYGDMYKLETENSVYITEVKKRTVA